MKKIITTLVIIILIYGCERKVYLPDPVPVSGKITLANGQPAKNVRIFFDPIEGIGASGSIKEDGTFSLQTYDGKPGACAGKYRIVFRLDQAGATELNKSKEGLKSIPLKYQEDNSPLIVDVPGGGKTDFDLKLDSR